MNTDKIIIHNNEKIEPEYLSTDECIEQNVLHPCNGILFGHKKEWSVYISTVNLKNLMLSETTSHKKQHIIWFHLYEIPKGGTSTETNQMISFEHQSREGLGSDY